MQDKGRVVFIKIDLPKDARINMVTDMTKETVLERGTTTTPRSALPEEVKEALRQAQAAAEETKEWLRNLTPPCPVEGKPGKFVGFEGAYTRGYVIYQCPKGHLFHRGARASLQR